MSETIVTEDIQNIIDSITKKENIENYNLVIHGGNKKGEGFLGELLYITITDKTFNKPLDIVIKRSLKNLAMRQRFGVRNAFLNEIFFYDKVWSSLVNFQREKGFETSIINIPKCLISSAEDVKEYLVFENLKLLGFKDFNKEKLLETKHFEYIFKEYGKLHGLGFVFKNQQPKQFSKLSTDYTYSIVKRFSRNFGAICKQNEEVFIPGEDDVIKSAYKTYADNAANILEEISQDVGKYSTILHGDCWNNNMMFNFDDENNITKLAIVDFQLFTISSPVKDLSYCLYAGAVKETLDKLDELLLIYYESLSTTMKQFGENPEELYPFDALKQDWKKYAKFGMIFSFSVWKVRCKKSEINITNEKNSLSDEYGKIIRDLIIHVHNNEAL